MKQSITTRLYTLAITTCLAACSGSPNANVDIASAPAATGSERHRKTPVVAGRAARMYIWAAFDENDCSALSPTLAVSRAPKKGNVALNPNQTTTIRHSVSGKCIGQKLPGTGIYFTARDGEIGRDTFTITASTKTGKTATRTFYVQITK